MKIWLYLAVVIQLPKFQGLIKCFPSSKSPITVQILSVLFSLEHVSS